VREFRLSGSGWDLVSSLWRQLPIAAHGVTDIRLPSPMSPDRESTGTLLIEFAHSNGHRYQTASDVRFLIQDHGVECLTFPRHRVGKRTPAGFWRSAWWRLRTRLAGGPQP
jgi:hypothetical protein